jgi:DNA-binding NarL/FixJ family response regulator
MPYSILVVEDQEALLCLLSLLIGLDPRTVLFGTARDLPNAARQAQRGRPDVIMCDPRGADGNGVQSLPLLREAWPDGLIVMYTSDSLAAADAPRVGVDLVVDKAVDPPSLVDLLVHACVGREQLP